MSASIELASNEWDADNAETAVIGPSAALTEQCAASYGF
jgi:hypothetical protein